MFCGNMASRKAIAWLSTCQYLLKRLPLCWLVPELVANCYNLHKCKDLTLLTGAVHSVVFAGFSAAALAARIGDGSFLCYC